MNSILILIGAIALSVIIGYKFKVNVGIVSLVFSYLLATFVFDIDVNELFLMWPSKLFILIFSVTVFYGFASLNGTMDKVAMKAIYMFRNVPALIPIAIYVITCLIAGLGGGPYISMVVMAPITVKIASISGMNLLLGATAIVCGGAGGSLSQISLVGPIVKGMIERTEYIYQSGAFQQGVFINAMIYHTLVFLIFYVILKGYKMKVIDLEKPDKFTREQCLNIWIIAGAILIYIAPTILSILFPANQSILLLKNKFNFNFIALFGAILCFILKLGNEKEVFSKIPWSTLILISGMGVLIGVGDKIGAIASLSNLLSDNISPKGVPYLLAIIGGAMSYVTDGIGVVMPTLYPLVPGVADSSGIDPKLLFSIISIGVSTTVLSPFSSGGAMFLSFVTQEEERNKLYVKLLVIPFVFILILLLMILLGIFNT